MSVKQGFFESDEAYNKRLTESSKSEIEASGGNVRCRQFNESVQEYQDRVNNQAKVMTIERATGYAPQQTIFESDEHYAYRLTKGAEEANIEIIKKAGVDMPFQTWDDSNADHLDHITLAANEARDKLRRRAEEEEEEEEEEEREREERERQESYDDDDYSPTPQDTPAPTTPVPPPPPKREPTIEEQYPIFFADPDQKTMVELVRNCGLGTEFRETAASKITDQNALVELYWENREQADARQVALNGFQSPQILKYITDHRLLDGIKQKEDHDRRMKVKKMTAQELKAAASDLYSDEDHQLGLAAANELVRKKDFTSLEFLSRCSLNWDVQQYARREYQNHKRAEHLNQSGKLLNRLVSSPWTWIFVPFLVIFEIILEIIHGRAQKKLK